MKKIFIVGSVASGKTTLAKKLSRQKEIPWYELDNIVHYQTIHGRIKRTPEEQVGVIQEIDIQGPWIFEGTDRGSYQCLYDMADTIIFLDTPLWKRRLRILTRYIKQNIGLEKSNYKPNLRMLKMMYIWTDDFERNRDHFLNKLNQYTYKVTRITDSSLRKTSKKEE